MINYKVVTLPVAEDDIRNQRDYTAFDLQSPETALKMVAGFREAKSSSKRPPFYFKAERQYLKIIT
nr:hypothetical protein [Sedimentibacter sp.]